MMEEILDFKVDGDLEKVFNKKTQKLFKNCVFKFRYSKDYRKAYKIIAAVIEDAWAVKDVAQDDACITIKAERRVKTNFEFPKTDNHFNRHKDRYQFHTLLAALSFVFEKNTALDIGGHIGLYSSALLDSFKAVIAFEPSPSNIKCFKKNASKAKLHEVALGDVSGNIELNIADDNTGNNSIVESFGGSKILTKIDTLDSFNFQDVSLIKIDVQGYEEQVLIGAKETILKNKPIIIVELITHKNSPPNEAAMKILESYGYITLAIMGKDYIMGPATF